MPRRPRPITESWRHALSGRAFVDAFLECAAAAVSLEVVPAPASEHVSFSLSFEELSGSIDEVRSGLRPEDIEGLQTASFRLSSASSAPGVSGRRIVTLTASPVQHIVSLDVQHAADTSVALDLLATMHAKFPRAEATQAVEPAARDGTNGDGIAGAAVVRLHPGLQVDHYRLMRRLGTAWRSCPARSWR
jgi:hypothetical protein